MRETEKSKECLEELPLLLADLEFKLRDTVNERNCLAELVSPSTDLLVTLEKIGGRNMDINVVQHTFHLNVDFLNLAL